MDVRSLMRRSATFHADQIAVIEGDTRLTYSEAWTRGLRMANALLSLGLEPGDRVAVLEDNTYESVDFFCGAAAANLVRVPLYPRNSREAHRHMLAHTGCRAVVVSQSHAHALEGIEAEVESLDHIIVRGDDYEEW
ncbi:MAG: AMP-binding protein, partial [Acidimicrobiales bacterium]